MSDRDFWPSTLPSIFFVVHVRQHYRQHAFEKLARQLEHDVRQHLLLSMSVKVIWSFWHFNTIRTRIIMTWLKKTMTWLKNTHHYDMKKLGSDRERAFLWHDLRTRIIMTWQHASLWHDLRTRIIMTWQHRGLIDDVRRWYLTVNIKVNICCCPCPPTLPSTWIWEIGTSTWTWCPSTFVLSMSVHICHLLSPMSVFVIFCCLCPSTFVVVHFIVRPVPGLKICHLSVRCPTLMSDRDVHLLLCIWESGPTVMSDRYLV